MQKAGKLELTWVGKYDDKVVEPRILMEDVEKSYGNPTSDNMLIHGYNLIALQALQQDFAGRIKCIYIDPPYNTGSEFEYYDDNLEHSIWLSLMKAGQQYNPDFLVETTAGKFMVEVKALNEVTSDEVVSKAREGIKWCRFASTADPDHKLWEYKLISDDNINLGNTCKYTLSTAHIVKEGA